MKERLFLTHIATEQPCLKKIKDIWLGKDIPDVIF